MNQKPSIYQTAREVRITTLRESPASNTMVDTPDAAERYWREVIATDARYSADVESVWVLMLNIRKRVIGHVMVSIGLVDQSIVHPREVFRAAIVANASAIVLMHNHPSNDTSPSDADRKVTRELINAGKILKIELIDHVIVGSQSGSTSLIISASRTKRGLARPRVRRVLISPNTLAPVTLG